MIKMAILLSCLMPTIVFGQPFALNPHQIAGSGGLSAEGSFSISGSIAEATAGGVLHGADFTLTGGFWPQVQLIQPTEAPKLRAEFLGGMVAVSWKNSGNWALFQNPNPADANGWVTNNSWTNANGTNRLLLPNPTGVMFFRLKQ